jgi:undecaprenyl-phosphate galactose phosphotransferase/putative colanic acid biosynthesis UDP-glucose lipid carrier transferase
VVIHLSQSPNETVSGAQAGLGHLGKLVSYGNIGFLVAALDFALIALSSVAADSVYHYFVLGSQVDISALLGMGTNSGLLFVLISASRGYYRTRALLSAKKKAFGIISSWIFVLLIMTALLFLLKVGSNYSRGSVLALLESGKFIRMCQVS